MFDPSLKTLIEVHKKKFGRRQDGRSWTKGSKTQNGGLRPGRPGDDGGGVSLSRRRYTPPTPPRPGSTTRTTSPTVSDSGPVSRSAGEGALSVVGTQNGTILFLFAVPVDRRHGKGIVPLAGMFKYPVRTVACMG